MNPIPSIDIRKENPSSTEKVETTLAGPVSITLQDKLKASPRSDVHPLATSPANSFSQIVEGSPFTKPEVKDSLFHEPRQPADFVFDSSVAAVFDDMVDRSVPFYKEIQQMIGELVQDFAVPATAVYDLGCATGNTLLALQSVVPPSVHFVGIDNSKDMLEKCRLKIGKRMPGRKLDLQCANIDAGAPIANASVVLLILTLQFIRPPHRAALIKSIHAGLNENGAVILVEKVLSEDAFLNRAFIRHYYNFKRRNGYSEMEIAQKREALENVLVPYTFSENRDLLLQAGFRSCEVFFKWFNFCGIVAIK